MLVHVYVSVSTVVNSQFYWSVCFCVYTYAIPPGGPCPYPAMCLHIQALCLCSHAGLQSCVRKRMKMLHFSCDYKALIGISDCYGISRHLWCSVKHGIWQNGIRQRRWSIQYTPLRGGGRSTVQHWSLWLPHKFRIRTSKYIWNIFLQSCVKRQAQGILL